MEKDDRQSVQSRSSDPDEYCQEAIHFVTHEMKNSLIAIAGFAKRLLQTEEDSERSQQLAIIYEQAKFMEVMAGRFLSLSQLETGSLDPRPDRIDDLYEEVVEPVIALFDSGILEALKESVVPLHLFRPIKLVGDRDLLRIVFHNLLSNAVKYRRENGRIWCTLEDLNTDYRFSVRNDGPGVHPDETARIFDKFYRSRNRGVERTRGTGLGLYHTRRIVEAHKGRIWCETETGERIAFFFTLPKRL